MLGQCTRCKTHEMKVMPIFHVHGHGMGSLDAACPRCESPEAVCFNCVTDQELLSELTPAVGFALGALLCDLSASKSTFPEHMVVLETARAHFIVYNNDTSHGRNAALRAVGLVD